MLSKTIATNEIQPVVLVLLGTLILGEALSNIAVLGILLIFAGVSLVVINQGFSFNRKLIPGIVGSGSWAIYWLIMTYAIQGSGNFALCVFISQLICMGMMLVYLA
ncbi:MAG: hypothetical protein KGI27_14230, partial [Thaumarchaeota archaeon]|nr:hypothetical protein [Nitrososphaerota archaeon]